MRVELEGLCEAAGGGLVADGNGGGGRDGQTPEEGGHGKGAAGATVRVS